MCGVAVVWCVWLVLWTVCSVCVWCVCVLYVVCSLKQREAWFQQRLPWPNHSSNGSCSQSQPWSSWSWWCWSCWSCWSSWQCRSWWLNFNCRLLMLNFVVNRKCPIVQIHQRAKISFVFFRDIIRRTVSWAVLRPSVMGSAVDDSKKMMMVTVTMMMIVMMVMMVIMILTWKIKWNL